MQYLVQCTRTRVARKNLSVMVCTNMVHEHMLQNNYFFAERRCDLRLFPTVSPWTPLDLQKKLRCADFFFFLMRVGQVLAWSCFRPFPTVSPLSLSIYTHIHHIQYIIIYCIYIIIYMYMYIFNSAYMYVHVHTHTLKTTMWLAFVHRWLLLAACAEKPHVLSKDRWPDKGLRFQGPVSPLILIGFPSYEWNHLSTCGNGISLLGVP